MAAAGLTGLLAIRLEERDGGDDSAEGADSDQELSRPVMMEAVGMAQHSTTITISSAVTRMLARKPGTWLRRECRAPAESSR